MINFKILIGSIILSHILIFYFILVALFQLFIFLASRNVNDGCFGKAWLIQADQL